MNWISVTDNILFYGGNSFIIWFAFDQWLKLKRQTSAIRGEIFDANKLFTKNFPRKHFAENYESIHQTLMKNKTLSHKWHEFTEQLIHPGPQDKDQVFMNSYMPSSFFSDEEILTKRLDLRWINSVPGKITALGILGTFVGLTFGVYLAQKNLASDDIGKMKEGLQGLLGGASTAFVTSLLGIIGSLLYSASEKKILNEIESGLSDFCDNLEKSLKFVTKEQLTREQIYLQREQLKVLESFSNDLAISIGNSLESKFSGQISGGFETLVASIDSLKSVQSEFSNDLLKSLTEKMSGGLSSIADERKNDALSSLKYMQDSMVTQMEKMLASQNQMQELTKNLVAEISNNMTSGQSKLNDELVLTVGKLQSSYSDLSNSLTARLEDSLGTMSERIVAMSDKMASSQTESISNFENVISGMSQQLNKVVSTTSELVSGNVNTSVNNFQSIMNAVSEQMLVSSKSSSEALSSNVNASAQKLGEIIEQLANIMKQSSEQTVGGIDDVCKKLNTSVDKFGDNVIDLNRYIEKNTDSVALSMRTAETYKEVVVANKVVGEQFGVAAAKVSDFSNHVGGLVVSLNTFSKDMNNSIIKIKEVNESTALIWDNYATRFSNVDESLVSVFQKLSDGTRDYNKILHTYVSELAASSDTIVNRFADAVEDLEMTLGSANEAKAKK